MVTYVKYGYTIKIHNNLSDYVKPLTVIFTRAAPRTKPQNRFWPFDGTILNTQNLGFTDSMEHQRRILTLTYLENHIYNFLISCYFVVV